MSKQLLPFLLLVLPLCADAQPDSIPGQAMQIASCRQQLIRAFESEDRAYTQFWMDSLRRLDDDRFMALQWDERWLLYFWLENYAPVFSEVSRFSSAEEDRNALKNPPPADSLFEKVDNYLYAGRDQVFQQIRAAMLRTEEIQFAGLLLEYLLRLHTQGEDADAYDTRLGEFLKQYPASAFAPFIRSKMYNSQPPLPPGKWALGADILFMHGTWTGALERTLGSSFGGDFALAYWQNRWNGLLRAAVGGQKLLRDVEQSNYIWEKDESATFLAVELELGYDIVNTTRFRLFPSIGGGYTSITPPSGDEDDPNPDYFDFFKFRGAHLTAALQADVKFKSTESSVEGSYHGVRVRMGYRLLNLDKENPLMKGNMFFFAVGYTLFGRQPQY